MIIFLLLLAVAYFALGHWGVVGLVLILIAMSTPKR